MDTRNGRIYKDLEMADLYKKQGERFKKFEDAVKARYQEEINNPFWSCSTESSAYKYLRDNNLI